MAYINKSNVATGNTIQSTDITNIVNALDGTTNDSIKITGDLVQGGDNTTDGSTSHAEGTGTIASGLNSHAEGTSSTSSGICSHAEGSTTESTGDYSHAEGQDSVSSGPFSHAEGNNTRAIGSGSHAEGATTEAIGLGSHAEGDTTRTGTRFAYYATDVINGVITLSGSYGDVSSNFNSNNLLFLYDEIFDATYVKAIFPISQSYFTTKTFIELYDNSVNTTTAYVGNISNTIAGWGGDRTIPANYAHAEGQYPIALGDYAHAEGLNNEAIGNASHAEGRNTKAIGGNSHAEGNGAIAKGDYSHAEGYQTTSSGSYSHAEGNAAIAIGDYSHAEGISTKAIGDDSHAEGRGTTAQGLYSHAEGYESVAVGISSHASGYQTSASGDFSFAAGRKTIATGSYQFVVGQFNTVDDTTSLFIVGGGLQDTRKDAFKVTHSSSIQIPQTQSAAPSWTGKDGEIIPATVGGKHFLYMWMNGAWRSGSFG